MKCEGEISIHTAVEHLKQWIKTEISSIRPRMFRNIQTKWTFI